MNDPCSFCGFSSQKCVCEETPILPNSVHSQYCVEGRPRGNFDQGTLSPDQTRATILGLQDQTSNARKSSTESYKAKKLNRKGGGAKPKRAKSFGSGLQRLMRMETRRGSLDERDINSMKNSNSKSLDNDSAGTPGSADLCQGRRATRKPRSDSDSGSKFSFATRRAFETSIENITEKARKNSNGKLERLKGFFKAISYTNVGDMKRNSLHFSGEICADCQQKQNSSTKDLHAERFSRIKEERDHLRHERDCAVKEWSEAASKWEHILDEMDSLLVELIQV